MLRCLLLAAVGLTTTAVPAQEGVTPAQVLAFRPRRAGIEIDVPTGEDIAKCKLNTESRGKLSGWVLLGPQGQTVRRFLDTNADGKIDEFRYYHQGMEVYRDLDTNGNGQPDQHRWLGSAGSRWGVDADEDNKIERWLSLSAEEATLEAVKAMAAGDADSLQALMFTAEDARVLGLANRVTQRLVGAAQVTADGLQAALRGSKTLTPRSEWERFDCSMRVPSLLSATPEKWDRDLFVYENVMAIVKTGEESGFVQIGELVRVGDVWKLTRTPQPIEGTNIQVEGGVLLQESLDSGSLPTGEGLTPEMQKLVDQLKELDDAAPALDAAPRQIEAYQVKRADLLLKIARAVTSDVERDMWWRQLIEGVAAAAQMGVYPKGAERLAELEEEVAKQELSDLVPFVRFRRLMVAFSEQMQNAETGQRKEIQETHLAQLAELVNQYPNSPEAPEAMWQVATTIEFNANLKDAEAWYAKLGERYPETPAGKRAKGAVARLGLKGKPISLSGPSLSGQGTIDVARARGKVVAVVFWTTWFKPFVDELPQLVEVYQQYKPDGFEIIGVNLDPPEADVAAFLQQHKAAWPQIKDPGGAETGLSATQFGITSPGTMFLIGKDGKVVSTSASLDDLKKLLPDLLKK